MAAFRIWILCSELAPARTSAPWEGERPLAARYPAASSRPSIFSSARNIINTSLFDAFGQKLSTETQSDPWGNPAADLLYGCSGWFPIAEVGEMIRMNRLCEQASGRVYNAGGEPVSAARLRDNRADRTIMIARECYDGNGSPRLHSTVDQQSPRV